jgi:hypothetical protein
MKKLLLVLVLIGSLLATPRSTHAHYVDNHYNVTLANGSVIYCGRVVYELSGRLECIKGYTVAYYEKSQYSRVEFVQYVWP